MRIPGSMLLVATLMTAAGVAAATPVGAAERLSDVAFMSAARCVGLAEAGHADLTSVKAMLEQQRGSRESYVQDKADELRQDARREARSAKGIAALKVAAELDGVCKTYLGAAQVASR